MKSLYRWVISPIPARTNLALWESQSSPILGVLDARLVCCLDTDAHPPGGDMTPLFASPCSLPVEFCPFGLGSRDDSLIGAGILECSPHSGAGIDCL